MLTTELKTLMEKSESAFGAYIERISALAVAEEALAQARYEKENAERAVLLTTDPKELGSNETQRTAKVKDAIYEEILQVHITEKRKIRAEADRDVAKERARLVQIQVSLLSDIAKLTVELK